MKELTKKEVIEIYEDFLLNRKVYKPAMTYNYFTIRNIQIVPYSNKEIIQEQARELCETVHNNMLSTYFQTDPKLYDELAAKGVKESDIKYEAKKQAVIQYFTWLELHNFELFTEYR